MTVPAANPQAFVSALTAITGAAHLRETDSLVEVAPGSTEEVSAILRVAHEHRLPVAPQGGGTRQAWGNAVKPAIVLHTHRMQALRDHTWQDMTCSIEAGCTWSAMQAMLAQHRQWVALDPLWPHRSTVGGVVGSNDSGVLRLHYGGLRDLIIGMTIVLADGTVAKTGGKVVKNVAGYDLHKLMIGAFGTLGIVTSVNFRLHSIPQSTQSFTLSGSSAEPLGKLMLKLAHAQLSTIAIQLRGTSDEFHLDLQMASLPEVLRTQAETLQAMAKAEGLEVAPAEESVWSARQAFMERDIACKGTMLPTQVAWFAERVRGLGGESATQATGIMTAGLPAAAAEKIPHLRTELEAAKGSLMILKQPAGTNLPCWGTLPDSLTLMRAVKHNFDPQRILNPGRFLGGI